MQHPGNILPIYDVAGLVGRDFDKAITTWSRFKKCILPYDRNIFSDENVVPSEVAKLPAQQSGPTYPSVNLIFDKPRRSTDSDSVTGLSIKSREVRAGSSMDLTSHQFRNYYNPIYIWWWRSSVRSIASTINGDLDNGKSAENQCRNYLKAESKLQCIKGRKGREVFYCHRYTHKKDIEATLKETIMLNLREKLTAIVRGKHKSQEEVDFVEDVYVLVETSLWVVAVIHEE